MTCPNGGRNVPRPVADTHADQDDAVTQQFKRFMRQNGIQPREMTPEQAPQFIDEVKKSGGPRIGGLYMRIYMRDIMDWLRRVPRGNE